MDLILFGIQGSGKGTQAKKLTGEFGYDIFETGGELRRLAASDTELGRSVKSYIDAGNLAPHEVVMRVVREGVSGKPRDRKTLFDGIPRDLDQMRSFDEVMREAGRDFRAVQIVVDPELCIQRILNRAKIEGRADDQNEASIRRRMGLFLEKTMPVIEEYRRRRLLLDIDGEGNIDEVYDRLKSALQLA